MEGDGKPRRHSSEFRTTIAQRMLAGESVMGLSRQHGLARSVMYRWRAAYLQAGPAGLARPVGRSPRAGRAGPRPAPGHPVEERLRQQVAELERKVGRQALEIDFFKRVFKRLEELPPAPRRGGAASSAKSGESRSLKTTCPSNGLVS